MVNFLKEFRNMLMGKRRQTNCSCSPYGMGMGFSFVNTEGGSAMNISAFFRGVDIISSTIATLPIEVKRSRAKQTEVAENHPLNLIFKNRDGGIINRYNAMKWAIQSVILKGNAYMYIERAEDGTPTFIRTLESSDVVLNWDKYNYKLTYQCNVIKKGFINPNDMIHLYNWTFDGVNGVSLIKFMARTLGIANSTEQSANNYYGGNMTPSAILTVTGPSGEQQRQQIRESWQQSTISNGGSGVAVLPSNINYQQISTNAEEAQLLQNRQFNVLDIARFLGISPILLGDLSHTSYGSLESVQQDFLTHTLAPYVVMIEEEFNKKLIKDNERGVTINLDETSILLTDKSATATYYSTLLNSGVLSINEVRSKLGYNSIGEEGDKHIIAYTDIKQNTIGADSDNSASEALKDDEVDNVPQEEKEPLERKKNKVKSNTDKKCKR